MKVGTYFGIPLYLHWSWFLFMGFLALINFDNLLFWVAAFSFVVLHEYGHCLAAKAFGLPVRDVTLYPIGGLASIQITPAGNWKEEFFIVLAGPAVNFLFVFVFFGLCFVDVLYEAAMVCLAINLVLGAFNLLIIAFPMDGGRIFRASLYGLTNDYLLSTTVAVRISQILCVVFITIGIFYIQPIFCLIFLFMLVGAQNELIAAKHYTSIHNIRRKIGLILDRPELATAPLSEVVAALEDVEDEQLREFLQAEELIPLLRGIDNSDKPK